MTTFRDRLMAKGCNYEPNARSSLDEWFSSIVDVPLDKLDVGDIARAIRQNLFLGDVLPRAEAILQGDPLAGDDYDGQLISSIASLSPNEAKSVLPYLKRISLILNQLDKSDFNERLLLDIKKIDQLTSC
ncbi:MULTISPECIES: contact-dependent growth inhibition system immunity protein [Rahnella]|uniref:contact-dependent growth inhibition system immunity protein n=1 Tax=Rahnella TaxID=34037 RepID=UPI003D2B7879